MKHLVAISILILLVLSVFIFPLDSYGSSVFYVSLAFFLCALLAASWKGGVAKGLEYLGLKFRKKDIPRLLFQSLILFCACVAITLALTGIFMLAGVLDTDKVYDKVVQLPVSALILAFTLAPLGEEAMFRGLLFRKMSGWLRPKLKGDASWLAAAVVSSGIFALLHASYGSVSELIVAFAIGMALCIGVKKANSLVPAVLAHAAFNFASIAMAVLF